MITVADVEREALLRRAWREELALEFTKYALQGFCTSPQIDGRTVALMAITQGEAVADEWIKRYG